jgi:hypothetical protein
MESESPLKIEKKQSLVQVRTSIFNICPVQVGEVIGVVAEEGEDWRSAAMAETAPTAQTAPGRTLILSLTFDGVSVSHSPSHLDRNPYCEIWKFTESGSGFRYFVKSGSGSSLLLKTDPACC